MQIRGTGPGVKRVREDVRKLSKGRRNVLVLGEAGVGKGLVAEAIHLEGKDARKPYVRLNVASIDPSMVKKLVESATESGELSQAAAE